MNRKNLRLYLLFVLVLLLLRVSAFAQITPSQDSYTNTAASTTNFGTGPTLGVVSSAASIQTTYIQFDLSSVPAGYTSTNVAKATLKLYVAGVAKAGSFNLDFVNGSWSEKTITAGLAPALGTTIASSVPVTTANANDYILLDVTSAVGEWLNGSQANDGIALVANSPLSATFDSKENAAQSHPAELDIVFTSGGTITGVTTAAGSGLTGGGTTGTLNLSLQKNCSSNQILKWSGSAWACASVGTGTITGVTAGTDLLGGGTSGSVKLSLDTTKVPQLNAANTFVGNQSVTGNLGATGTVTGNSFVGNGSALTSVNAAQLGGHIPTYFANTVSNTFSGPQIFLGNGNSATIGDMGCGSGFVGMALYGGVNCELYAILGDTSGNLYLNRATGGTMHFRENNGDEMTIAPGGAVGIGTTTPGSQLEVDGQWGASLSSIGIAVLGAAAPSGSGADGADGISVGGGNGDLTNGSDDIGGIGIVAQGGNGVSEGGRGGWFFGGNGSTIGGDAIAADVGGPSGAYAGNFGGDVNVTGAIFAGAKDFKIDHPVDPANMYLYHASVESSEMMNIYSGNVILDANGAATIQLPEWFEALNNDFRYQLTAIGAAAPGLHVATEVANHQFAIAGGAPGMKVSWQLTAVRHDAFAKAHPLVVEQEKNAHERGFYIHPELYGQPNEKQIEWGRNPATMRHLQVLRSHAVGRTAAQQTVAKLKK